MAVATDTIDTIDTRGPGLSARLSELLASLGAVVSGLDPDRMSGIDAASLYDSFAALERLSVAGKTVLAPRVEASGVWREGGHRDAASLLASLEGVSTGQARGTLANGRRLDELPGTSEVLRQGKLSAAKLTELCGAGVLDPAREPELLAGAADQPLAIVKERCRRSRATSAGRDPLATVRKVHADRHFTSWTDAEGAFCFQGRDTADRGAKILGHLGHAANCLQKQRSAGGHQHGPGGVGRGVGESADGITQRALWADAFFALVTRHDPDGPAARDRVGSDLRVPAPARRVGRRSGRAGPEPPPVFPDPEGTPGGPSADAMGIITRPPTCTTVVRVDLDALLRGRAEPGELCEIDGQGPIPVAMARDLANDSALAVLFHRAGDVRAISHLGRTINARLRTALVYRDRTCVVPGCGVGGGPRDRPRPRRQPGRTHRARQSGLAVPPPSPPEDLRGLGPRPHRSRP